jgi:hypothetical protein
MHLELIRGKTKQSNLSLDEKWLSPLYFRCYTLCYLRRRNEKRKFICDIYNKFIIKVNQKNNLLINKSECVSVCMFEINSLTPQSIQTKFGVATIQNPAENIGYIGILSL